MINKKKSSRKVSNGLFSNQNFGPIVGPSNGTPLNWNRSVLRKDAWNVYNWWFIPEGKWSLRSSCLYLAFSSCCLCDDDDDDDDDDYYFMLLFPSCVCGRWWCWWGRHCCLASEETGPCYKTRFASPSKAVPTQASWKNSSSQNSPYVQRWRVHDWTFLIGYICFLFPVQRLAGKSIHATITLSWRTNSIQQLKTRPARPSQSNWKRAKRKKLRPKTCLNSFNNRSQYITVPTQTMHYYKGNPLEIQKKLHCLIPPTWVPFNDPCSIWWWANGTIFGNICDSPCEGKDSLPDVNLPLPSYLRSAPPTKTPAEVFDVFGVSPVFQLLCTPNSTLQKKEIAIPSSCCDIRKPKDNLIVMYIYLVP